MAATGGALLLTSGSHITPRTGISQFNMVAYLIMLLGMLRIVATDFAGLTYYYTHEHADTSRTEFLTSGLLGVRRCHRDYLH